MTEDIKQFLRDIGADVIRPRWFDMVEAFVLSLGGVLIAGVIVAFATWMTVG